MTKVKIKKILIKKLKPILRNNTFFIFGTVIDTEYINNVLMFKPMKSLPYKYRHNALSIINNLDTIFKKQNLSYYMRIGWKFELEEYTLEQLINIIHAQLHLRIK